jgi:hypothetical protein
MRSFSFSLAAALSVALVTVGPLTLSGCGWSSAGNATGVPAKDPELQSRMKKAGEIYKSKAAAAPKGKWSGQKLRIRPG